MLGSFAMTTPPLADDSNNLTHFDTVKLKTGRYHMIIRNKALIAWVERWMSSRRLILETAFFKVKYEWSIYKEISRDESLQQLVTEALEALTLSTKGSRNQKERNAIKDLISGSSSKLNGT